MYSIYTYCNKREVIKQKKYGKLLRKIEWEKDFNSNFLENFSVHRTLL